MQVLLERFKKIAPYLFVILFISWASYRYFRERSLMPKESLTLDWKSLDVQTQKTPASTVPNKVVNPIKENEFNAMTPAEKDTFLEYDNIEKKWLEIVKKNLSSSEFFKYLELRKQNDEEKMSAYQEYHAYLRQEMGDKFEYNISEDQSEREKNINQHYLNKLLDIIGPAKFQEYLKSRDQFNEESRRNNKEFIIMEF